jgi:membrane protease YdiL (CAAX protease family)
MRRPGFWIALVLISVGAAALAVRYFPQAFSIIALDIRMDRERALAEARIVMAREQLGPAGYRQAASFALDEEAQTFVELEGGGKDVFTSMLRDKLYAAYAWRVRQFKDGDPNETTIRFTPDGQLYGFVEKVKEDAPGAALDAAAARRIAEDTARTRWNVDLSRFTLVEQGDERRPSGRVDYTFTYERTGAALREGRYRLRLAVSGDRLSEVTHFIKIPEAFTRRYASMRSANDAIGAGSVIAMALLYVIGGIGVGLFFMMRRRYVLWHQAAFWGIAVSLLQALASLNEFPLLWMGYDTAVPRSTFVAQQLALIAAGFFGFAVFFGLSFMAAETLSRRAFGRHPQLWKVWSPEAGPSVQILGRTVGGYLLVTIFFAYDVVLYLVMTRLFGWWSPADALVHPDVLATYAPWLSAIANSFQAGFWEESLFRAIPIAGAALIGERLGQRRLFIVLAFVVQALVFGAGHAPYPNQPAYSRPVELIIPSIGFGLLYLYFGLLPGIVLHFTFDVIWFALPVFLANAPGIWFQRFMIVALTLVPLWVVLVRRLQIGRWTELSPSCRNAAWTPPPAEQPEAAAPVAAHESMRARTQAIWLAAGAACVVLLIAGVVRRSSANPFGTLPITRERAQAIARGTLESRGVHLSHAWRIMAVPDDGSGAPHEYVVNTAGEQHWRELLGVYLPKAGWRVRVATFAGDVEERAEEWRMVVTASGEVRALVHELPEARAGASLDENAARQRAVAAIKERLGLDAAHGDVKELAANPSKQKARTDWTFTFADETRPALQPLLHDSLRIDADLGGDEVTGVRRYVHVPEQWEREHRAGETRRLIVRILVALVFGGILIAAGVAGMMAWSRRRFAPRLFAAVVLVMLGASSVTLLNRWPLVLASLSTAAPLGLQLVVLIGVGLVGLVAMAALVALAVGRIPHRLASAPTLAGRDSARLGVAAGLVGAAVVAGAALLVTPVWRRTPDLESAAALLPFLQAIVAPIPTFFTRTAVLLAVATFADRITAGWTRRRPSALVLLFAVGFIGSALSPDQHVARTIAAGALTGVALATAYATLLRHDISMVPLIVGFMIAAGALAQAAQRVFPQALAGNVLGAALTLVVAGWLFATVRRLRAHASEATSVAPTVAS